MQKLQVILKQIRVVHWAKNLLVFAPLFFNGTLDNTSNLFNALQAFIAMCFVSSSVYIINDLKDIEQDRRHEVKKNRPLAARLLSKNEAVIIFAVLLTLSVLILLLLANIYVALYLALYMLTNLAYTYKLKHLPLWDIITVGVMYILRLEVGAAATNIIASGWLIATVFFGALILIIGKRYAEIREDNVRKVLKYYTENFLHTLLLMCMFTTLGAFIIYTINFGNSYIPALIIFTFINFRYYYLLDTEAKGQRPEVLLFNDKQLLAAITAFALYLAWLIYF